jgi:hypothetical protein
MYVWPSVDFRGIILEWVSPIISIGKGWTMSFDCGTTCSSLPVKVLPGNETRDPSLPGLLYAWGREVRLLPYRACQGPAGRDKEHGRYLFKLPWWLGVRRFEALLLVLVVCVGALAAVTITNVSEWHVQAVKSPIVKYWNSSLYPVVNGSWKGIGGLNITYYGLFFVPGWQEDYVVGRVANTSRAVAHFEKLSEAGSGTYNIYLGSQLELSNSQASGPDVSLPASIRWSSTASNRYSVLAWLVFRSGATARQMVNFTAQPMSRLYTASRTCSVRSFSDDFSGACVRVQYSFSTSVPNNRTYVSGKGSIGLDSGEGNPAPSLYTESRNGYASFFIDYSSSPFSASAPFAFQYFFRASLTDSDYLEVNFFTDMNGDSSPDLEVIYYGSGGGTNPYPMAPVIYGSLLPDGV